MAIEHQEHQTFLLLQSWRFRLSKHFFGKKAISLKGTELIIGALKNVQKIQIS